MMPIEASVKHIYLSSPFDLIGLMLNPFQQKPCSV